MGLQPKIEKKNKFVMKQCSRCGETYGPDAFAPTKSWFYPDGVVPICDSCIKDLLSKDGADWSWEKIDKLCRWADVPFMPKEWETLRAQAGDLTFHKYCEMMSEGEYSEIDWKTQYERYKDLAAQGSLDGELPRLSDELRRQYRERWGAYDDDGYQYLENLYKGLMTTQNVNGALQVDQAIKICKISYEVDKRIEEGTDFDKLLSSYDKLVKAADFTPKNVKNINDFDTIGELVRWMEKRGWKNRYYDDVSRDVVDETIMNIQNFNRRLYTNESGIGDDITHRIEMLKTAKNLENDNYYGTDMAADLDNYDNDGYEELTAAMDGDFQVDLEEENE